MGIVYVAALIVGLGVITLQLSMSGDHGVDQDIAASGAHAAGDDADGAHHGTASSNALAIVSSVRFWSFGALGFGLLGTLLHYLRLADGPLTAGLATGAGALAGAAAAWIFRAVSRSATASGGEEHELLGQVGRVLVPLARGQRGKVRMVVRGRTLDYVATTDDAQIEVGQTVLVEEVRGQELHVSRAPELEG